MTAIPEPCVVCRIFTTGRCGGNPVCFECYQSGKLAQIHSFNEAPKGEEVPVGIIFFSALAMATNSHGLVIPRFWGKHREVIERLRDAGYDWQTFKEVTGRPGLGFVV